MADTGLQRFVSAQDSTYVQALAEVRAGDKTSHWMWFVFPQLAGLGRSPTAQFYGIADRAEACAYLAHSVLGLRLREITGAMLAWAGRRSATAILGSVDALKFRSSMTLFEAVAEDPALFAQALDGFCDGQRDPLTVRLLATA
ncbi:calpastatin [Croceibacterium mercuriale]|uniref:Calpastatin n=1 Tax=Croceibacterium mercuriale TaxID=1572751 RepID=A0A0B2BZS8_9SPHN|nr:DUF1810 domain-containing protein [Croceibacterium mercuriale]KHL25380.1 calpastatin [Croceibacterium mercuriale]